MLSSKFILTDEQIGQVSNILADLGIIVVAAAVIPSIFIESNLLNIIQGSIVAVIIWYLSIKTLKL